MKEIVKIFEERDEGESDEEPVTSTPAVNQKRARL